MVGVIVKRELSASLSECQEFGHAAWSFRLCERRWKRGFRLVNQEPSVATATRTLQAAGFDITNVVRHPGHIEYQCEREDAFGANVRYLIVISPGEQPSPGLEFASKEASAGARTVVAVARVGGDTWLSWNEFLSVLGGAVPTWRALDQSFPDALRTASRNELPHGASGEAWRLFEEGVADGLEFIFGRRVKRMGGVQRFKPLPDMLALTPDDLLMLVDAKAAGEGLYEVERPKLRPLAEYVERQRARQIGAVPVGTALIVAGFFEPKGSLDGICNDFMAANQIPLALLEVETLLLLVGSCRDMPSLRAKLRWRHLFYRAGLIPLKLVEDELHSARSESWSRELRLGDERGDIG